MNVGITPHFSHKVFIQSNPANHVAVPLFRLFILKTVAEIDFA